MNIGFIQGRLCDCVNGKIQSFPWLDWEGEFPVAKSLNFSLMEWTLDHDQLYQNPLMTEPGRERIRELMTIYGLRILSLTGDCFMQVPFFKFSGLFQQSLIQDLQAIIEASRQVGITFVTIPLVDNGSLETQEHQDILIETLLPFRARLVDAGMKILFESDLPVPSLAALMHNFPIDSFGINYDIGNSAALGYSPLEEIATYGNRIHNVHVKDRLLQGTTVPLGTGNADFPTVFSALHKAGYTGKYVLQTARAEDNDHAAAIKRYRDMTLDWLVANGS